jgi:hypothetical protein
MRTTHPTVVGALTFLLAFLRDDARSRLRYLSSVHPRLIASIHEGALLPPKMEDPMTKRTRTVLLLVVMLVTGGIASIFMQDTIAAQGNEAALPEDVGDLSNATTVEVKDSAGTVVLRGHFVDSPEDDDDVERKATLTGINAKATGQAEIEVSRNNNRLDQEVEVSVTNLAPDATYTVFVDAKQVGTFQTNKNGKAEMELATASVK